MSLFNMYPRIMIIITACYLFAGCNNTNTVERKSLEETSFQPSQGVVASPSDSTLTIRLAVNETYCKETACSCIGDLASRDYSGLQDTLKRKYNIDLQLTYMVEEYDLVDSLITQKFDGTICKPWMAFMLTPKYGIKYKRIADLLDPSNNQWLSGIIIVKKDSPIKTLKDADGKSFAIGQEDSYEKFHAPLAMLEKEGVEPSQITNKAGCTECIGMLLDNKAEVAIISDYALTASCAVDIASPDDFTTIGTTEKIPLCSVILDMAKISEPDALRLQKALLEISGANAPKGLSGKGFVLPSKWAPTPFVKETKKECCN